MNKIALTEAQIKVVLSILSMYFPDQKYFVFGSRSTLKNLKPFSDLDLAIRGEEKIVTANLIMQAQESFSSSDLPFKVDLIDLNSISKEFLNQIVPDLKEIKISD